MKNIAKPKLQAESINQETLPMSYNLSVKKIKNNNQKKTWIKPVSVMNFLIKKCPSH